MSHHVTRAAAFGIVRRLFACVVRAGLGSTLMIGGTALSAAKAQDAAAACTPNPYRFDCPFPEVGRACADSRECGTGQCALPPRGAAGRIDSKKPGLCSYPKGCRVLVKDGRPMAQICSD